MSEKDAGTDVDRQIITFSLLTVLASFQVNAEIPGSLGELLADKGCRDVSDDPKVTRFEDHWWISLEPYTGGTDDYALYCEDLEDEASAKLIVVVRGNSNPWGKCDAVVNAWQGQHRIPTRYSIRILPTVRESKQDLGSWWLVSSSWNLYVTFGPEGEKVTGPVIDTGTPAGAWYACELGEWYRLGVD